MVGIPGLDRAAMEKERLARMAARGTKRERSVSPPPLARGTKFARTGTGECSAAAQENTVVTDQAKMTEVIDLDPETTLPVPESARSPPSPDLKYPHGVIKKTWAFGHARTGSDIKIEEVLEKSTLRTGILSAFQWDTEWVFSKLDMSNTKLIFIMQAKEQALRDQMLAETADLRKSLRLLFPPMDGQINCMHSKLMLLFHPHKLRIVVPSANLTNYDWGETGIMENSVFLIDLPRLPPTAEAHHHSTEQQPLPPFAEELLYFLQKQGLDDEARNGIRKFDFSATKDVLSFVHSVGGASYKSDMQRTGFTGLNQAIKTQNLTSLPDLKLDFCASSIGALNDSLLDSLHAAARGTADTLFDSLSAPRSGGGKTRTPTRSAAREVFKIYFPTLETVKESTGGVDNGGTICFQRKWWEDNNLFPRECFREYRSVRRGLLSHNKIIFARGFRPAVGKQGDGNMAEKEEGQGGGEEGVAWAYVGSANMSESAWGKQVWDRSRKEWKMNCRNWECGVVVKVSESRLSRYIDRRGAQAGAKKKKEEDESGGRKKMELGMDVFDDLVDVPFEYPGEEFGGKEPWYFMESR